ncbi:MAG: class I SAM-dependent methyltransferase [Vicinamibacterales bacterium]
MQQTEWQMDAGIPATAGSEPEGASAIDRMAAAVVRRRLERALADWRVGRLTIHLPDGAVLAGGAEAAEPQATVWIRCPAFFRRLAFGGDLGAGESFMDGDWHADDLPRLIELVLRNEAVLSFDSPLTTLANLVNDWRHRQRANTRKGSRRNIEAHYDLSNALFETFLDPSMAYSAGVYADDADGLAEAQARKFRCWTERLQIGPDDHVLEIGSGWGGFAMHAARATGCRVTGITVSREQLALSRERVRAAGLEDRVDIQYCDYRDVTGRYSRIVSIEMIEAVGREFWPGFFRAIDRALAPGGRAGIQAITMPDHRFDRYARHCDWIQKHIFPGGLLPCLREVAAVAADVSALGVIELEDRPLDYARTLAAWRRSFLRRLDRVRALGFDERFIRMWDYYLASCEAAFRTRHLGLAHLVLARAGEDLRQVAGAQSRSHEAHEAPENVRTTCTPWPSRSARRGRRVLRDLRLSTPLGAS